MAGASSGIQIDHDDADVQAALKKLLEKLGNLEPFFRDLGESLLISHRARFDRAVSPSGVPWPDLSPGYRDRKKKNRDKILVLDGWLRQLNYAASGTELRIGTDRIYGAIHQFGDPSRNIPARPFLGLDEAERKELLDALADWLAEP